MPRYNKRRLETEESKSDPGDIDFTIVDGMQAAVEMVERNLPIASMHRGVVDFFDTSEAIGADEANIKFGLTGEAAFTSEDTDITIDKARARAEDLALTQRTEFITGIVNSKRPVMGRISQFVASLAVGFVDPVILGTNLGVSYLLGKGVGSIVANRNLLNRITKANPTAGKMLTLAYTEAAERQIGVYLAREGAENLIGSLAEETVNFVGIGEERLARKVTTGESMINIAAGTILGTGLGTVLSSGGRKSFYRSVKRKYGDSAEDIVKHTEEVIQMEAEMNIPASKIQEEIHDQQTFDPKPHHLVIDDPIVGEQLELQPAFIPKDKDGAIVSVSDRGKGGVSMTMSGHHAQNKGESFVQYDNSNQRFITKDSFDAPTETKVEAKVKFKKGTDEGYVSTDGKWKIAKDDESKEWRVFSNTGEEGLGKWGWEISHGTKKESVAWVNDQLPKTKAKTSFKKLVIRDVVEAFVKKLDKKQTKTLIDIYVDPDMGTNTKAALKKEIKKSLEEAVSVEEVIEHIEHAAITADSDFNIHPVLDSVLDKTNYDGYHYKGKGAAGREAYDGIYIKASSAGKSKKVVERVTPKPGPADEIKMRADLQGKLEDYGEAVDQYNRVMNSKQDKEMLGLLDDPNIHPQSDLADRALGVGDKQLFMIEQLEKLENKMGDEGIDALTLEERQEYLTLKEAFSSKSETDFVNEQADDLFKFIDCKYGKK
jgi:hypothetical protein